MGLQKDLERAQRHFTRRLRGLSVPYDVRLSHLQLKSLKDRKLLSDLVIAYKALLGMLGVSTKPQSSAPTRNNSIDLIVHKTIIRNTDNFLYIAIANSEINCQLKLRPLHL